VELKRVELVKDAIKGFRDVLFAEVRISPTLLIVFSNFMFT
jgi:hypothetical protein